MSKYPIVRIRAYWVRCENCGFQMYFIYPSVLTPEEFDKLAGDIAPVDLLELGATNVECPQCRQVAYPLPPLEILDKDNTGADDYLKRKGYGGEIMWIDLNR